jgi:hypothetical protein
MMKKLLLLLMIAFVAVSFVNAQSFSLLRDGDPLPETITITSHPDSTHPVDLYVAVKNISDNILNVRMLRTYVDLIDGAGIEFCFAGQCEAPFTDTSGLYVSLPAGASTNAKNSLEAHYHYPVGTIGTTIVQYTFFDKSNFDDNVTLTVNYVTSPTAIDENIANSISLSDVYPNPTHNTVNVDYNFDVNIDAASVKIVNLLGAVVKEVEMDQNGNKLSMDVSDLTAGIYFYSVVVNNEIFKTKKLVIR